MQKTTSRYLNVITGAIQRAAAQLMEAKLLACQWMWFAMIKTVQYMFPDLFSAISSIKLLILCDTYKIIISQIHCMTRVCSHAPMNMFDYETFDASFDYRFLLLRLMSQVSPSRLF